MPRPSKHVSPDTLGGRIRAAREYLHLSLAEVASGHYSTSLISQIERNRVDPSRDSLRFLAERLKLSVDDLEILAHQHRETEVEAREYTSFEALRNDAARLLAERQIPEALRLLEPLYFSQVPSLQRWRLAALRGQCYFEQRRFVKAQTDLVYATQEEPQHESLPLEQKQERMLLHLHLAATYRELHQLEDALEQFYIALRMMNRDTPFGYVAEAHWGMSLIALAQATQMQKTPQEISTERKEKLSIALEHAENARFLYLSIGEKLHAASVACNIAEIEYALGQKEKTLQRLLEIVDTWKLIFQEPATTQPHEQRQQKERANVVSTACCLLAEIELADEHYEEALSNAKQALEAGARSYILRRADAYIMLGRIFGALHNDEQAEQAFRNAIHELEKTERIGVRISTHVRFASYLLNINKTEEGQQELEKARLLSDAVLLGNDRTSPCDAVASEV
ncbi:MAG: hypothetical protein PVS3B3_39540 [Ktedonobacteraceae bacterium]